MSSRSSYYDEFPREKYHSNQAAWSPSWLTNASNGSTYEKDYRIGDEKRIDRGAPQTEFPVTTERTRHVSHNFRHTNYDTTTYGPPQDDYPFLFSDPVDGASVRTGMSQQELLRQKARESKQRYKKSKTKKPVVQITGFLSSRNARKVTDATRLDDLSTAETTVTDSSLRHRTKSNTSFPLRVVLDGGDLVLTAKQNRFKPEFTKRDEDFPLLSRSASGSFQMDFLNPSDSSSGRRYELPNPHSIERERSAVYRGNQFQQDFSNGKTIPRTNSAELRSNQSDQNSSSREWLLHSAEGRAKKQHSNRSVQFREEIVRPASFDSKHSSREILKNCDQQPKSILRKSRYHVQSGGVRMSSSPSRFIIRKPVTPERKIGQHLAKSAPSLYSPSDVLDETGRIFSPVMQDAEISGSSAFSDERYPDPPLDSIPIDDDETTLASRNDAFLETVAAIVIQTNARRFLAMRYVDRLTEQIVNEMHAKYVRLYKNEHRINGNVVHEITPSTKSDTNRAQTSFNAVPVSPQRTDHNRILKDDMQQEMGYDLFNLAAIRIQAAFRGFWARDSLDVEHFCASLIQKYVRRYLCETKYKYGHYHVYPYAVRIQTTWRGVLAKQNLHRSIGAAILIQAYARGFIERLPSQKSVFSYARRTESGRYAKTEKLRMTNSSGDPWQKGLANDLWQARKNRTSETDDKNAFHPPPHVINNAPTHPTIPSMSFRKEQNRSTSFTYLRDQRTESSTAIELSQPSQVSDVKALAPPYQRPAPSKLANFDHVAANEIMAATKIQARYRTHTCERKLIRSLVDILIVQTVARRWIARRRAARLRTLRDRCRTIVANRESESNKYKPAPARLVSRSEFFQNRILPKGLNSHPQLATTQSGPSFDEDEYYQSERERSGDSRDSSVHRVKSMGGNNRQSVSYGERARGPSMETRDHPVSSQPPQWANVSLRSTKSKGPVTVKERSGTTPQLIESSGSESRVYSMPSYDSEATNAAIQNGSSARRQVVVTPPALLKKNTDRKVLRR
ncbi:hypothetical protein FisN_8Lh163 [Fistulifera solaris]|uniref:Uncharacterized protein n=1 Tax=Fistulifera solaris TaxID=1519565 RepID=A0A1Z5JE74_FISSO|nr:hypothetical protein FisN_8Lh163 [Fistulifera solaris]|eukprot:GAX12061.1 hypothetical protein FisN_8Lh163 [Fistulifera solaris]